MDWEHINAIFWMSILGIVGGILISLRTPFLIVLGVVLILLDVYLEYYFLKKMDTREQVTKTKQELQRYVDEAKKLKFSLLNTAKEIQDMKNKVFDVFSQKGFKKVEERLKELEDVVEGKYGRDGLPNLKEDVEKIKRSLGIWH